MGTKVSSSPAEVAASVVSFRAHPAEVYVVERKLAETRAEPLLELDKRGYRHSVFRFSANRDRQTVYEKMRRTRMSLFSY